MKQIKLFKWEHIYLKRSCSITLFLMCAKLFSQNQPSFTQYMNNEVLINPAYTGSHDALSLGGVYRSQWSGVEGAPVTQSLVVHTPLRNKKMGIGITILTDHIGVYNKNEIYLNYAYRILMKKSVLSFGLLGGVESVRELYSNTKTTQAQDKQFMYDSPQYIVPNFGFGIYYYRSNFYVGISVPRLMNSQFYDKQNKIIAKIDPNNFTYYTVLGYIINVNENFKLKPTLMIKNISGAPLQSEITMLSFIKNALWLGVAYRSQHTIAGIIGLQFTPQFKVGYSYDYILSDIQKYHLSTHEIHISYVFKYDKSKRANPRLF